MVAASIAMAALWCQPIMDYEIMTAKAYARAKPPPAVTHAEKVEDSWRWVYAQQSILRHRDKLRRRDAEMRREIYRNIEEFPWLDELREKPRLSSRFDHMQVKPQD